MLFRSISCAFPGINLFIPSKIVSCFALSHFPIKKSTIKRYLSLILHAVSSKLASSSPHIITNALILSEKYIQNNIIYFPFSNTFYLIRKLNLRRKPITKRNCFCSPSLFFYSLHLLFQPAIFLPYPFCSNLP